MTTIERYTELRFEDLLRIGDWSVHVCRIVYGDIRFHESGNEVFIKHNANNSLYVHTNTWPRPRLSAILRSLLTRSEARAMREFSRKVVRHNAFLAAVKLENSK
jgi:hypothetical protein